MNLRSLKISFEATLIQRTIQKTWPYVGMIKSRKNPPNFTGGVVNCSISFRGICHCD